MDRAVLLNDITKIASVGLGLLEDLRWNYLTAHVFPSHCFASQKDVDTQCQISGPALFFNIHQGLALKFPLSFVDLPACAQPSVMKLG